MTPHKQKAESIIQRRFQNFSQHEQNQLRKLKKAKQWESIFPWLSMEHQFQVLVCEVYDTIENHKKRLTNFGKATFEVGELAGLYQRYYKGLHNYEHFPFLWFGDAPCLKDCVEIARLICSIEIRRMNGSLAYLRHDLESILAMKQHFGNMCYRIDLLGANVRFDGLTEEAIKQVTTLNYLNVIVLPFEGRYKNFLANYMLDNQLVMQKRVKENEANGGLFARNLAASLAHYESNRSLFKTVKLEAELQGSAGSLAVNMRPWHFPLFNPKDAVLFAVAAGFLFSVFNLSHYFGSSYDTLLGVLAMLAMSSAFVVGYRKRVIQEKNDTKTALEAAFIREELQAYSRQDDIFDKIFQKLRQSLVPEQHFTGWLGAEKKYGDPADILKVYGQAILAIDMLDTTSLRDFRLDIPKNTCFEAMLYVLRRRTRHSLMHFLMLLRPLISHKIEATVYIKFLDINTSTHGFYGDTWHLPRTDKFQKNALALADWENTHWVCPDLDMPDSLKAWVGEQESLTQETQLAYDLQRLTKHVDTYKTHEVGNVPLMLDLEEIAIYF